MNETIMQQVQAATAISSPAHLKEWLRATGRTFLVMRTDDLVDALPWPDGVDALIQMIEAYRQHRAGLPVDYAPCPKTALHAAGSFCDVCRNSGQVVARTKSDQLEQDEIVEALGYLRGLQK